MKEKVLGKVSSFVGLFIEVAFLIGSDFTGTFGNVELATHRHFKTKVALKIINKKALKDAYSVDNLHREPFLMMDLNHPNVSVLINFYL